MNANLSTGDGPADPSGSNDPESLVIRTLIGELAEADAAHIRRINRLQAEHAAWAEEQQQKIARLKEVIAVRERLRRGEAVDGEDPQDAEVSNRA